MTRPEYAALLRNLTMSMTIRYGESVQGGTFAHSNPNGAFDGKTVEQWDNARTRQFKAIQRLTLATLRLAQKGA